MAAAGKRPRGSDEPSNPSSSYAQVMFSHSQQNYRYDATKVQHF